MARFSRVALIVLDSVGIGALPDADQVWGYRCTYIGPYCRIPGWFTDASS